jgi:hypothetical protein
LTGLQVTSKVALVVTSSAELTLETSGRKAMIVLLDDRAGIAARRVHLFDRLAVRLRASQLDSELAGGAAPESDFALALHAERLTRPSQRRALARSLQRIVSAAEPSTSVRLRVPLCRDRVCDDRTELEALSDRLLLGGPVCVQGVAMVRVLLADGAGPLYRMRTARDLRAELSTAMAAMDPLA